MVGSLEVGPQSVLYPSASVYPYPHQSQQGQIEHIQQQLAPLSAVLEQVAVIEEELHEANIEENDYTVFTHSDLDFELKLVQQIVVKKIKFIDNQVHFPSLYLRGAWHLLQHAAAFLLRLWPAT